MKHKTNRTKVNFYIDLGLFILLAALIGIGILIKYILIPGQERWLLYGENMQLTFMGLDRQQWGTIHLVIGIVFFVGFLLHFLFHWDMIKTMCKKCLPSKSGRAVLLSISIVAFVFLIAFPFFVKPVKEPVNRGFGPLPLEEMGIDLNDSIRIELMRSPKKKGSGEDYELQIRKKEQHQEIDIKGNMTLKEVAEKYQISEDLLKMQLGIHDHTPTDQQLGQLKKRYGFTMQELRDFIKEEISESRERLE